MKEQLQNIKEQALKTIGDCVDVKQLDELRVKYLGKKGELTAILKSMGKLSAEERPVMGQLANDVRQSLEGFIAQKQAQLKSALMEQKLKKETLDVTMPGSLHGDTSCKNYCGTALYPSYSCNAEVQGGQPYNLCFQKK